MFSTVLLALPGVMYLLSCRLAAACSHQLLPAYHRSTTQECAGHAAGVRVDMSWHLCLADGRRPSWGTSRLVVDAALAGAGWCALPVAAGSGSLLGHERRGVSDC